jgi:alkanesulfonate monooxygenase SsuD/methylene tetrahydromethanopterin reductase-like flavin-dependent oxidoreductase (luciferase family)
VAEHFLEAPGLYGTVWMSPLLCLAHAARVTTRIRLATGLLILPYYHPVTLAREIQTLWHLSGGRFVLGVGPDWDQHEFETLGMKLVGPVQLDPIGDREGQPESSAKLSRAAGTP